MLNNDAANAHSIRYTTDPSNLPLVKTQSSAAQFTHQFLPLSAAHRDLSGKCNCRRNRDHGTPDKTVPRRTASAHSWATWRQSVHRALNRARRIWHWTIAPEVPTCRRWGRSLSVRCLCGSRCHQRSCRCDQADRRTSQWVRMRKTGRQVYRQASNGGRVRLTPSTKCKLRLFPDYTGVISGRTSTRLPVNTLSNFAKALWIPCWPRLHVNTPTSVGLLSQACEVWEIASVVNKPLSFLESDSGCTA